MYLSSLLSLIVPSHSSFDLPSSKSNKPSLYTLSRETYRSGLSLLALRVWSSLSLLWSLRELPGQLADPFVTTAREKRSESVGGGSTTAEMLPEARPADNKKNK